MSNQLSTRVVVTGLGLTTPLGLDTQSTWQSLLNGKSCLDEFKQFNAEGYNFTKGGEILDKPLTDAMPFPVEDRAARMMAKSFHEAWHHAGLGERTDVGIVLGTNFGSVGAFEDDLGQDGDHNPESNLINHGFNHALEVIQSNIPCYGPTFTISLSCGSGTATIGEAFKLIQQGHATAMVAGGFDAISKFAWSGLCVLRTMSANQLRPFHAERDGTIFSEGSGAMVLESLDSALERGATILAEVRGYDANNNAFHMTAPAKEGDGLARTMQGALEDAHMESDTIDHINVHGTGTPYNDITESQAIHRVFSDKGATIPLTSIKSMLGHTMGAAGTIEGVVSVLSLMHQCLPPTIHLDNQDPECGVTVVANEKQDCALKSVLSNSSGIGGNNASIIFSNADDIGTGK